MEQRQLFSAAPVAAPGAPAQQSAPGSSLAAALAGQRSNFALPTPSLGVPLSSMMATRPAQAAPYRDPFVSPSTGRGLFESNMAGASTPDLAAKMNSATTIGPNASWLDPVMAWLGKQGIGGAGL